jgi:beta-lactamase class A
MTRWRHKHWSCLMGFALACAIPAPAKGPRVPPSENSPARAQVEQLIQQAHADVSVAFRSLDGAQQLFIKADEAFPAAPAVIQIPVMIELYTEAQAGEVRLTDTLVVHNTFHSVIDGAVYHLDPKTDPDQDLYKSLGKPITLQDLCEHMVARNSSLAADLLIERLGLDRVRERIESLHADGIQVIHAIEPDRPNDKRPDNATTTRAVLELLWTLTKGQDAGDDASKEMVGMLARAGLQQPPTAGMPSDPRAAQSVHLAGIGQQAMIEFGPHPFIVVILTRGMTNPEASAELMAQIEHALAAGLDTNIGN